MKVATRTYNKTYIDLLLFVVLIVVGWYVVACRPLVGIRNQHSTASNAVTSRS